MSKLTDKASYLKGLAEGMRLNMDKDANKLLLEVLAMLSDVADELEALSDAHDELNEYVESIDDDLADLEETLFGDDDDCDCHCGDDCDCDCDDDDCDCGCHCHDDDDDDIDADELIAYACPSCGHEIEFRASDVDFDEDYLCPACNKPIFPELEEDEDADEEDQSEE